MTRGPKRSFDVDRLRELAIDMTAAEAAKAMNVSRQRIYQVARREGIRFCKAPYVPKIGKRRGRAKQVSRVITGGVSEVVGDTRVSGRICELLVAADLVARGWKVFFPMNMNGPHDLVASKGDKLRSFEVRAAKRLKSGKSSFRRDDKCASDFYALVIRGEPVEYEPELR
jgi:hypothetical protein